MAYFCGDIILEESFKLQKKAVRSLTLSRYNSHTEPLFKYLRILKISDMYNQQELKFYFRYVNKLLPDFFANVNLMRINEQHGYNTTGNLNFVTYRFKYNFSQCSMMKRLPRVISNSPISILNKISTHSLNGFSNYIKVNKLENYDPICRKQNCYICQNVSQTWLYMLHLVLP